MNLSLHKKQMMVLQILRKGIANEILWGGAMGGGKSFMLRALAIIFCMEVPNLNVYLFRRIGKDLIATHMRGPTSFPVLLQEFVEDKLVNINKSSSTIEWSNNSVIVLNHIQHESDLERYLSSEIHVALFDEATTFTPKMIKFIRSRIRLGSLKVPEKFKKALPFIVYATNPRGPSHLYFKSNFVDVHKALTPFIAPSDDGGMTRIFIPALLTDNPTLTKNDPNYRQRAMGMGDPEVVEAYLNGDWSCAEGAALPTFSRQHHVVSTEKVKLSTNWDVRVGYDYGFSAPYSVLFYIIATGESEFDFCPPKGSVIIVDEIYGDINRSEIGLKEDVAVTADKILERQFVRKWVNLLPGPADKSIFAKEQGPSIASIFLSKGIRFEESNKSPGSRIRGLSIIRELLLNSIIHKEDKPGLYIFDRCVRLIQHLSALSLDNKTGEDVDTTQPDHDWDVLRYIILHQMNVLKLVKVKGL